MTGILSSQYLFLLGAGNADPFQIGLTLAVLAVIIVGMTILRLAPDLVLLAGLTILLVANVVSAEDALSGFSNKGLATVAVLFIVAEALNNTGSLIAIGQRLMGTATTTRRAQFRTMLPAAILSAFMNNTPVVAVLMPVIGDWGRKNRVSVSHLLMPLSFAAILGGLCTLIGTSTTMVINDELPEQYRLGMWTIAWVGLPALFLGMIYIIACAKWLLPERRPAFTKLDDPREYTVEMLVEPESPLVGSSIEAAGLRQLPGMYLMEIDRRGHVMAAVSPETQLEANDRLIFVGVVESIVDLQKIPGLKPATDQLFKLNSDRNQRCLVEAVVSNSYPYLRTSIRESGFRSKYNAAVIAVARDGARLRRKIGDIALQPGDTLLLECHPSFINQQRNSRHFYLVSRVEDSTPIKLERAWLARIILIAMVISVSLSWLSMFKAALLAAGLMVLTRCLRASVARRSVDWSVIVVMAAGLGLGKAIQSSGTDSFIANGLIDLAGNNRYLILAVIYGLTMLLSNLITAKAAALLMLPIAMATGNELLINIMPFVICVIMGAAASFATPIGYQTNLMVYGPGGYRSSDYLRLGGPLSLIVMFTTIIVAPLVWQFDAVL